MNTEARNPNKARGFAARHIAGEAKRQFRLKIDLNAVPSSMEQLADSWKGNR